MSKQVLIVVTFLCVFVLSAAAGVFLYINNFSTSEPPAGQGCTQEAKLCPDGSAVGRTGPKCEFAECPQVKVKSGTVKINQTVMVDSIIISPLALIQDSRCPIDVNCIWAGTVTVRVKLQKLYGEGEEHNLTLGSPTVYAVNEILLKDVFPAKQLTVNVLPEDYVFEFVVSAASQAGCTKDSDCPSNKYVCEELEGVGTACPSTDPDCVPTHTITKGECKLKAGNSCRKNSECGSGTLCHNEICISPVGKECKGPNDKSCPGFFECRQDCGPPVTQYPDETPITYHRVLQGYDRPCPICLAKNTMIDTPNGGVAVQDMKVGMVVWTTNNHGDKILGTVMKTSKISVPETHKVLELSLSDGRKVFVSPQHPTIDGRTVYDLKPGRPYNGATVVTNNLINYTEPFTYDILPSGETAQYWANGILLNSTLK